MKSRCFFFFLTTTSGGEPAAAAPDFPRVPCASPSLSPASPTPRACDSLSALSDERGRRAAEARQPAALAPAAGTLILLVFSIDVDDQTDAHGLFFPIIRKLKKTPERRGRWRVLLRVGGDRRVL